MEAHTGLLGLLTPKNLLLILSLVGGALGATPGGSLLEGLADGIPDPACPEEGGLDRPGSALPAGLGLGLERWLPPGRSSWPP